MSPPRLGWGTDGGPPLPDDHVSGAPSPWQQENDRKKAAGLPRGSAEPNKSKVGKLTKAQVREIAEIKLKDLEGVSLESAMLMIEGTARSMGVTIEG